MRAGGSSVKRAENWRRLRWHVSVARMKWLFWDGIYLNYEMGYKLQ